MERPPRLPFTLYFHRFEKKDKPAVPDEKNKKPGVNYGLLVDGAAPVGAAVKCGDAVIGRVTENNACDSIVHDKPRPGRVAMAWRGTLASGEVIIFVGVDCTGDVV